MSGATSFSVGERVRLLRLDDEFFYGIDAEDVPRLKKLVGLEWTVSGDSVHGYVEIVFEHSAASPTPYVEIEPEHPAASPTPLEWVCIPPTWIERVT